MEVVFVYVVSQLQIRQNFKMLRLLEDLNLWHIWNTRSNLPDSIINPTIWFEWRHTVHVKGEVKCAVLSVPLGLQSSEQNAQ